MYSGQLILQGVIVVVIRALLSHLVPVFIPGSFAVFFTEFLAEHVLQERVVFVVVGHPVWIQTIQDGLEHIVSLSEGARGVGGEGEGGREGGRKGGRGVGGEGEKGRERGKERKGNGGRDGGRKYGRVGEKEGMNLVIET